jgi:hypothetical protein
MAGGSRLPNVPAAIAEHPPRLAGFSELTSTLWRMSFIRLEFVDRFVVLTIVDKSLL